MGLWTNHPYYPPGVAVPGYVSNTLPSTTIQAIFAGSCAGILFLSYSMYRSMRPDLRSSEIYTASWFTLCGFIHLGLQGYYAVNAHHIGGLSDVVTQVWKEYSLSDSRYMTRDSFIVCLSTVTAAVLGPLSLLCARSIVGDGPRRHALQIIVSVGQLYGSVLYFATCAFDKFVLHKTYSRPEPFYFWGYHVLLNSIWIWIPVVLLMRSIKDTRKVFARLRASYKKAHTKVYRR